MIPLPESEAELVKLLKLSSRTMTERMMEQVTL